MTATTASLITYIILHLCTTNNLFIYITVHPLSKKWRVLCWSYHFSHIWRKQMFDWSWFRWFSSSVSMQKGHVWRYEHLLGFHTGTNNYCLETLLVSYCNKQIGTPTLQHNNNKNSNVNHLNVYVFQETVKFHHTKLASFT